MQSDSTAPVPGKGPLLRACTECSAPFRTYPSLDKRTCSPACRYVRQSRLARERNSRPCVICGTMFYDTPGAFEKEGRRTCGLTCRNVYLKTAITHTVTDPAIRFAPKVIRHDEGCWGWVGATDMSGYGMFWSGKRLMKASRFAWELTTGERLTPDDVIGHVCDNPPCTRNDDTGIYEVRGRVFPRRGHLFKTDDAGNTHDMIDKGRKVAPRMLGTTNPNAKLTESEAREILALKDSGRTNADVGNQFGITPQMVWAIWKRESWTHLD